jgi:hypothetical protein
MAGSSKSYFRKTVAAQRAGTYTVEHPDGLGTMTVIPQFQFNPGSATMNTNGLCTANSGDVEYFAQEGSGGAMTTGGSLASPDGYVGGTCDGGEKGGGPEQGMGGPQENHEPWTSQGGYQAC